MSRRLTDSHWRRVSFGWSELGYSQTMSKTNHPMTVVTSIMTVSLGGVLGNVPCPPRQVPRRAHPMPMDLATLVPPPPALYYGRWWTKWVPLGALLRHYLDPCGPPNYGQVRGPKAVGPKRGRHITQVVTTHNTAYALGTG